MQRAALSATVADPDGVPRLAGAVGRDRRGRAGRGRAGRAARGRDPAARGSDACRGAATPRPGRSRSSTRRSSATAPRWSSPTPASSPNNLPAAVGRQRRQAADRHPPRLAVEGGAAQGRRGDGARRAARAGLPPPASISGSTGATSTCVVQMGAPKGSSRLLQRIGRANHRLDQPEPRAARARQPLRIPRGAGGQGCGRRRASATARTSAPAGSTCSRSTSWPAPAPAPFDEAALLAEVRSSAGLCLGRRGGVAARARLSSPPAATRCAPTTSSSASSATRTAPGG